LSVVSSASLRHGSLVGEPKLLSGEFCHIFVGLQFDHDDGQMMPPQQQSTKSHDGTESSAEF
jgi:hypothetical protein